MVVESSRSIDEEVGQLVDVVARHDVGALGVAHAVEQSEELLLCRELLFELIEHDHALTERVDEVGETFGLFVHDDDRKTKLLAEALRDKSDHERLAHTLVAGHEDTERTLDLLVGRGDTVKSVVVRAVNLLVTCLKLVGLEQTVPCERVELHLVGARGNRVVRLNRIVKDSERVTGTDDAVSCHVFLLR